MRKIKGKRIDLMLRLSMKKYNIITENKENFATHQDWIRDAIEMKIAWELKQ